MKRFGGFLMRGRWQASSMAFLFAILPLLNCLSLVIVALITLRKGAREGAWVAVCAILPAIGFILLGHSALPLTNGILWAILVWFLATILRGTASWSYVLIVAAAIGVGIVLAIHGYSDDIGQWWQQTMLDNMQMVNSEVPMDTAAQQQILKSLTPIATGIITALGLLMSLVWLVLARNWQAVLYNPGQLRPELQAIRMPRWGAATVVIIVALEVLTQWMVLVDLLPVILLPFVLTGLSLVHFFVTARKLSWIWLVAFYVLLVLFLPYLVIALVLLAVIDSFWNLRQRFS